MWLDFIAEQIVNFRADSDMIWLYCNFRKDEAQN